MSNDLNYDRTEDIDRLLAYVKAIPLLTIDPTQRLQKKVQDLESEERLTKEELEEIRRQWMIDLQKERAVISLSEWNALMEQMNKLGELLNHNQQKQKD